MSTAAMRVTPFTVDVPQPALEEPELLAEEIRAFFRPPRRAAGA